MEKVLVVLFLLLAATTSNAENLDYINFAIKQAHSVGFYGCESAIKSVFSTADGNDIRVKVDYFEELKKDTIKLTATWGSQGDSIYSESEFRKLSGKCFWTRTGLVTTTKSCAAYANEMNEFKFTADMADFTWMEHKNNGVTMQMKPFNGGCVAIYQSASSSPYK